MPFFVLAMEASSGRTAMTRPRNISNSVELLVPDSSGAKLPSRFQDIEGSFRKGSLTREISTEAGFTEDY